MDETVNENLMINQSRGLIIQWMCTINAENKYIKWVLHKYEAWLINSSENKYVENIFYNFKHNKNQNLFGNNGDNEYAIKKNF